jgi:outer membrane biosynthesis protein TonB
MRKLTKEQREGVVGTIIIHIIIVVVLMLVALRTPLPLPGEEGVEVNFGYDETGSGNVQKDNAKPKVTPVVKKKVTVNEKIKKKTNPVEEKTKSKEENLTQDVEDVPSIDEKKKIDNDKNKKEKEKKPEKKSVVEKKEVKKTEKVEKPKEEPKPVVNERALFKGTSKKKDNGQNQGVKKDAGDQGKPHGYKDSNRYEGLGGRGDGIAFSLGGRGSKYLEKPSVNVTETGKVVVSIWVNPQGKVVRAQVNPKGTTVIDPTQRKIAVEAALNSVFEKDPSAPAEQRGTITYQFILLK